MIKLAIEKPLLSRTIAWIFLRRSKKASVGKLQFTWETVKSPSLLFPIWSKPMENPSQIIEVRELAQKLRPTIENPSRRPRLSTHTSRNLLLSRYRQRIVATDPCIAQIISVSVKLKSRYKLIIEVMSIWGAMDRRKLQAIWPFHLSAVAFYSYSSIKHRLLRTRSSTRFTRETSRRERRSSPCRFLNNIDAAFHGTFARPATVSSRWGGL
jgi:hypothetical protein